MRVVTRSINLSSSKRLELIDITRNIEEAVSASGIGEGQCIVHAPHATAAIVINEHEEGLVGDILAKVEQLFPRGQNYRHNRIDDNADSHLASAFLGATKVIPILGGKMKRGTWQNVFLLELDGPRSYREVVIQVLGEVLH